MIVRKLQLAATALALTAGCANQDQIDAQQAVVAYQFGNYAEATRLLTPLAKKTNEDFVLNNCRLGSSTLAMYDLVQSQAAFLQAYEVLNSFGTNDGGRTAGAVLVDEKIKIWRGEPFERAMANFYLGLTCYMQGDFNNARGAFENALFKLRDYQTDDAAADPNPDKYRDVDSNFVLAHYLLARCYQRLDRQDLAAAAFKRVATLRPELSAMADEQRNHAANVLLVVDWGFGPRKATTADGTIAGFYPTPAEDGPIPRPMVIVDGRPVDTTGIDAPLVDLVALAQDRKWQSIDTIRTIKSVVGTGLIVGGAYETLAAEHQQNAEIGLGLLLAGILLKLSSQADTRVWEMLPRATFAIALPLPPGPHDVTIAFPGRSVAQTWHGLVVPSHGDSAFYFRMQGLSAATDYTWPPPTLSGWPASPPAAPVPATEPSPGFDPSAIPPP
jgi:tetratricopeptide (TPR) repeat protein